MWSITSIASTLHIYIKWRFWDLVLLTGLLSKPKVIDVIMGSRNRLALDLHDLYELAGLSNL